VDRDAGQAQENMRDRVYGDVVNVPLLDLFEPGRRVLDIGCGTGTWAPNLRLKGAEEIVGVEFAPEAADRAAPLYDRLLREPVEGLELCDLTREPFDTIIVADVIEHLVDPWRELRRWTQWVGAGGQLVVSVPNLRHFRIVRSLLCGRFDYTDSGGVMDRTHLRWFTRASLASELLTAGWAPTTWGRPHAGRSRQLDRVTLGRVGDFLLPQLRVVSRLALSLDPARA
jgi:2-polyprenyl-3-methyl-5-hydroxy-6-metoxy-1,4-benzoquinol methylase